MSAAARAAQLVEVAPGEWDGLLDDLGLADAYLRRAYVEASCVLDPGRPAFLYLAGEGGNAVFAAIVRDVPGASGCLDVTTPYGYGGPVVSGSARLAETFYELYGDWCSASRVVATFIRFHPLLENWRYAPSRVRRERLADTASWSLAGDGSDGELFAGMHRSHRNKARKARGAGVDVTAEVGPRALDAFVDLHLETMARHGAEEFYFFPREYWSALADGLGDELVRFEARLGAELVATALLLATRPSLHYHMGVTSDRGRALGASNLLLYEAARWGRSSGFAELHLGSGLGGREDSLWLFKQRFAPRSARQLWIGKLVHDEPAYRELAGTAALDGFFPAYRAAAGHGR